jgi:type IV secretion system protein VirB10
LAAKTLYLPNGYSLALTGAPGANAMGITGVSDVMNRHFLQRYGSAAVLSLVTAGIRMATYAGHGGLLYASPGDAATNGAGQVLGQATGEDLRRSMNIRPTVQIRAGYPFNVTVVQDLVFPAPYALNPVQIASTDSREESR